jgi:PAP2 superfamily protein
MTTASGHRAVRLVTRAGWAVGLGAIWGVGYFAIGARTRQTSAFNPSIVLDAWIPFIGWAIWPYLLGIVGIALPAALIRKPGVFLRTAAAYGIVISLSFLCFYLLPTNAENLRQHASTSCLDALTGWAIGMLYAIDPATNLFPSLHVSLGTLSALALAKEYVAYGRLVYLGWALVSASVCAVKQHAILDVLSGTILALAAFGVAGRVSTRRGVVTDQ